MRLRRPKGHETPGILSLNILVPDGALVQHQVVICVLSKGARKVKLKCGRKSELLHQVLKDDQKSVSRRKEGRAHV